MPQSGLAEVSPVPRPSERVSTREIVQMADECYLRPQDRTADNGRTE